jgi:hypothetical protein
MDAYSFMTSVSLRLLGEDILLVGVEKVWVGLHKCTQSLGVV